MVENTKNDKISFSVDGKIVNVIEASKAGKQLFTIGRENAGIKPDLTFE